MNPTLKVVCGIIWKGNEVFIARRRPDKHLGGYWEFPGGKIEHGEDPESALERELLEEIGMRIHNVQFYGSHKYEYEDLTIELVGIKCQFSQATFLMTDHDQYIFLNPYLLPSYSIAPADLFFVAKLLEAS